MRLYAKSAAAANFMAMYVDEVLNLGDITKKSSRGYYVDISNFESERLEHAAKLEGIGLNEFSRERPEKLYPKSKRAKDYILNYISENFGEGENAFRTDDKGEYVCMFQQQVFDLVNSRDEYGIEYRELRHENGKELTIPADKLMPSEESYEDASKSSCTITAKSAGAANFLLMYVEEELEKPEAIGDDNNSATLNKAEINELIRAAAEYNDISKNEWEISCGLKESYRGRSMRSFKESTSNSDRIYVAAKTVEAKDALEEAGYERSGIVFDMTAGELADILENVDIDLDEIDVKDENGEPIEDVYSYVFDTDEVYDEYDDDFGDFEDDDEVYFEPGEGDDYFLDDEDDLDF